MKAHCSDLLVHVPPPLPPPPSLCLSFIPLHPSPLHPSSTLLFHPISPLHPIPFLHPLPRAALPDPPSQVSCRLFPASNRHSGDHGRSILDTLRLLQGSFGLMALPTLAEPFLELPAALDSSFSSCFLAVLPHRGQTGVASEALPAYPCSFLQ